MWNQAKQELSSAQKDLTMTTTQKDVDLLKGQLKQTRSDYARDLAREDSKHAKELAATHRELNKAQQQLQHLNKEANYLMLVAHGVKETSSNRTPAQLSQQMRSILCNATSQQQSNSSRSPLTGLGEVTATRMGSQAWVANLRLSYCACRCHLPSLMSGQSPSTSEHKVLFLMSASLLGRGHSARTSLLTMLLSSIRALTPSSGVDSSGTYRMARCLSARREKQSPHLHLSVHSSRAKLPVQSLDSSQLADAQPKHQTAAHPSRQAASCHRLPESMELLKRHLSMLAGPSSVSDQQQLQEPLQLLHQWHLSACICTEVHSEIPQLGRTRYFLGLHI